MALGVANEWARNGELFPKVFDAILAAAHAISTESDQTTHHAERIALAGKVLMEPDMWAVRFGRSIVVASGVTLASTDQAINDGVSAVWDALALAVAGV